jgi:hypothetical protein
MRLLVIDVEFNREVPEPHQLLESLELSLVGGVEIEHLFVIPASAIALSCCFFVADGSATAVADAAMITRRALVSHKMLGSWMIARARDAI